VGSAHGLSFAEAMTMMNDQARRMAHRYRRLVAASWA
jgi:hypothetical protein